MFIKTLKIILPNKFFLMIKNRYWAQFYITKGILSSILHRLILNLFLILLYLCYPLLFILYKFLKLKKIIFVYGISSGVGHFLPETDRFFLEYYKLMENCNTKVFLHGDIKDINFFLKKLKVKVIKTNKFTNLFVIAFGKIFNQLSYNLSNSSIGQHKINFKKNINEYKNIFKNYNKYLKLRNDNDSYFSYLDYNSTNQSLKKIIEKNKGRIISIHCKMSPVNALGSEIDLNSYYELFKFLKKKNYYLINIGRESMNAPFDLIDFDYSQSNLCSLKNDFYIVKNSEMCLFTASGASYIADTLNKPYLYVNTWHISRPGGLGRNSIILPSRVYLKENDKLLSIYDQAVLENTTNTMIPEIFYNRKYYIKNVKSEDMIEATVDLLEINKTKVKEKYIKLSDIFKENGFSKYTEALINKNFIR